MKICSRCRVSKGTGFFSKRSLSPDGLNSACKDCIRKSRQTDGTRAYMRAYRNSEKAKEQRRERENRPEVKARNAELRRTPEGRARLARYRRSRNGWAARLRSEYGLSLEAWDALVLRSEGRCGGCLRKFTSAADACIDHDHRTGKVRGLLCHYCNRALGFAQDNPATLRTLAVYLEIS